MQNSAETNYVAAGVDTEQEESGLQRLVRRIQETWPKRDGIGRVRLPVGFFANVIDISDKLGLAISADGVGSKVLIAQMMRKFETVGIDCVAMNVNDLLCVGATPISMVDYIALQTPDPSFLDDIAKGLSEGANLANISIPGGEIAQVRDLIKGYPEGSGFDLAGMAVGTVDLNKIIVGDKIEEGDVLIGIESSGIHSNGVTLARRVLFEENNFTVNTEFPTINQKLGDELLKPTHIYVREAIEILNSGIPVKALIHITSDGFLNLVRVVAEVGYVIEELPATPPIFSLIQNYGKITDEEMFSVYNMGIGFVVIVPPSEAGRVTSIIQSYHKKAYAIGRARMDPQRRVEIRPRGITGIGKRFFRSSKTKSG